MRARDSLSLSQARRVALAAQGLANPRPAQMAGRERLRRALRRVGLVQLDSVNVVARSHELVFLARVGPYDRRQLGRWLWGSGEVFEYWGHEASLLPVALHPLLRWRMARGEAWEGMVRVARERPALVALVRDAIADLGPVALGDIERLRAHHRPRSDSMWAWSEAKRAVEWLFWTGEVTAVRDPTTFTRRYALPEVVLPAAVLDAPTPDEHEAHRQLLVLAAKAQGVATAADLADYFRLHRRTSRSVVAELVQDGLLREVQVEGWRDHAYLHPGAVAPRQATGAALLSPFDSLVWDRARLERLFGLRYRVEIYVPAAKRVAGYYVLPFLQGEDITARVDLKADRAAGAMRVRAAHREPGADQGGVIAALVPRLLELAGFLGLADIVVEDRGDLAPALARAAP